MFPPVPRTRRKTQARHSLVAKLALMSTIFSAFTPGVATAAGDQQPAIVAGGARADSPAETPAKSTDEAWAWHAQATSVTQHNANFSSPYSGFNSLIANGRTEETTDVTLYAGARLWSGAEFWINPEIDQGFGLSNTVGMAGFPSGEAYKIGANTPYLRVPRAFVRQVIPLGGDVSRLNAMANQLGGSKAADNVTLTVGKFSVTDIFDANAYAHDPRADFLNWSIIDAGAFDYAADAWGFTYGAAAEWTQNTSTVRAGIFQLSSKPNGKITGVDFNQYMLVTEFERRYQWRGHAGKVKLLGFINRGRMGAYRDALQLGQRAGDSPDTGLVRRFSSRAGGSLNLEQELNENLGLFVRASGNNGSKEAYEFTEINRSIAAGVSIKGDGWGRLNDMIGIAGVVNGLSGAARAYFAAGGIGILIGDGQQSYGTERIFESYYAMRLNPHVTLAANYQRVNNPAYNHDRGPVSIFGLRAHAEF